MNIKEGDLVSIKQDFIDKKNRYEYDSRDIWNVKEVYGIGNGHHVAIIDNLTGYGNTHLCTYNMDLRTMDDLKARLDEINKEKSAKMFACERYLYDNDIISAREHNTILNRLTEFIRDYEVELQDDDIAKVKITI